MKNIGRQGAFLLFLAEIDVVIAYSLLVLPAGITPKVAYKPFLEFMPLTWWAAWWAATAAVCLIGVPRPSFRPIAFMFASAIKTVWGIIYFVGWLQGDFIRGYLSTAIFLTFAMIVQIVSGWREVE